MSLIKNQKNNNGIRQLNQIDNEINNNNINKKNISNNNEIINEENE